MNRRDTLVRLMGLGVVAIALAINCPALGQSLRKPVHIGVLSSTSPEIRSSFWENFKEGMVRLGWTEGRDVIYSYRYARGDGKRFDALAAELVKEKPDLIFAGAQGAALAVKRATVTIPIVFAYANDPVESGLVASLARPGGNATGLSSLEIEISPKHLELLKEIQPRLLRVTVLVSTAPMGQRQLKVVENAARTMGIEVNVLKHATSEEIDPALESVAAAHADGVLIYSGALLQRRKVVESMAKLRIPAVYGLAEMVTAGGLISYGAQLGDNYRQAASYVDKILKGAKPADLPVQQSTRFELVVNLKTARDQGITIPQSILVRADRVIE